MADMSLAEQSVPATPSAGVGLLYVDSTASLPAYKNDAGEAGVMGTTKRTAVTSQAPAAATDVYITNSGLLIPSFGVQAGSQLQWDISVSKTAAGTAAAVFNVRIGANQTTADTSRLTLTQSTAQTAATDTGIITVLLTVQSVSATGVIQGTVAVLHNAASVGLGGNVEATSAAFDNSALAGQFVGLSVNTGASAAWTITQVQAKAWW